MQGILRGRFSLPCLSPLCRVESLCFFTAFTEHDVHHDTVYARCESLNVTWKTPHTTPPTTTLHTRAFKGRNHILSDIKKYESMSFQEGSTGASLKAEAVAKLRTELEQVPQDLPQPLPRNIYVRKDKEAKALKQELSNNMTKILNLMAMKQKLENETNCVKKRMEDAEAERDLAFSQISQEQSGDTDPEVADQLILEALTSEAAVKPVVDTWMSESAHTVLGIQRKSRLGSQINSAST